MFCYSMFLVLFIFHFFVLFTGYGVGSDEETSYTAKVMLVSLVPLIILVLPKIFDVAYDSRKYEIDILVTLITLVVTLVAYFIYQVPIFSKNFEIYKLDWLPESPI